MEEIHPNHAMFSDIDQLLIMKNNWVNIFNQSCSFQIKFNNCEFHRKWMGMFGVTPHELEFIWIKIKTDCTNNRPKHKEKHLLWAMNFMRVYETEDRNSMIWKIDRSNFRLHTFSVIRYIHINLSIYINIEERFFDWNLNVPSFVIDTTHCPIEHSKLENEINKINGHTFKDKKHACYSIKYQIVVSMSKPRILHVSNGYPGSIHDLTIARLSGIVDFAFENGEVGIGDKAYRGCDVFVTPFKNYNQLTEEQKEFNKFLEKYRNNVERVNNRLKIFKCMEHRWRHSLQDQPKIVQVLSVNISFIFRPLNIDDTY